MHLFVFYYSYIRGIPRSASCALPGSTENTPGFSPLIHPPKSPPDLAMTPTPQRHPIISQNPTGPESCRRTAGSGGAPVCRPPGQPNPTPRVDFQIRLSRGKPCKLISQPPGRGKGVPRSQQSLFTTRIPNAQITSRSYRTQNFTPNSPQYPLCALHVSCCTKSRRSRQMPEY